MADPRKRLHTNAEGDFYVDSTCIDCGTCRILAPENFGESNDQSFVKKQPEQEDEILQSLKALTSCPTGSIGTNGYHPKLKDVIPLFPERIQENVYYCGFHSEKSYGAFSYFLELEDGNILIDSPRFTLPLVKNLEKKGGVKYIFLTHQDDIADHEQFHKHFGCKRIIHEKDQRRVKAEIVVQGEEDFPFLEDILLIPVPGHTRGSLVLLYKNKYLFTGDHLAYSTQKSHLYAFKDACWFDWKKQIESMEKLSTYQFLYVLPGHGKGAHFGSYEETQKQMKLCIQWMKTV
jgi:glyoxylase-like metal-dependent hydrolase (beta-lactamase superfamily II)/ferredoxin